jgi:hypothetical protein
MFKAISTQEDFELFKNLLGNFHDGIIREASIISNSFIDNNLSFYDISNGNVRLIIFIEKGNYHCIEIILEVASELFISLQTDFDIKGSIGQNEVILKLGKSYIRAERMKYRFLGKEYLGQKLHFTEEVPVGDVKRASLIEDEWYQCPNCKNGTKVREGSEFFKCTECGVISTIKDETAEIKI